MKIYFPACLLIFLFTLCTPRTESSDIRLDYYFDPQPTALKFSLPGDSDSIRFSLNMWQHVADGDSFDTTIAVTSAHPSVQRTIFIEKPVLIEVHLNGHRDEIFLLPGQQYQVDYEWKFDELAASFQDHETTITNRYYDTKSSLVGNEDIRVLYSSLAASSVYDTVIKNFVDLRDELLTNLEDCAISLDLPAWFINYESQNIRSAHRGYSLGLAAYQRHLGIEVDARSSELDPASLEDETALVTDLHFGLLDLLVGSQTRDRKAIRGKPIALMDTLLKNSVVIRERRMRDLYLAKHYRLMHRSSFSFPEEVTDRFLSAISDKHRDYVKSLAQKPSLTGRPAPNFYLKNESGEFVRLRDFQGQTVLLNFWSVNCPPCFKEFEHEAKLLQKMEGRPFSLVKICLNTEAEAWRRTLAKHQVGGVNLLSNEGWDKKIARDFNRPALSQYMLIGPDGMVINEKSPKPSDPKLQDWLP